MTANEKQTGRWTGVQLARAQERRSGRRIRALLPMLVGIVPLFTSLNLGAEEPSPAVWKLREISFFYRSYNSIYPCHELRNTVANIMMAIGARDDIDVRANDCNEFSMLREPSMDRWDNTFKTPTDRFKERTENEQRTHVRIRMMYPIEVTPQVLEEIDRDKSRRELVSRVTGNRAAAMNDPIVFAAQRQPVTLSRELIRLEARDCQLLEQMSRSVFRELKVNVVRGSPMCDRDQVSRVTPQLTVEALLPVVVATQQIPGAAQFDPASDAAKKSSAPPGEAAEPQTPPAPESPPPKSE